MKKLILCICVIAAVSVAGQRMNVTETAVPATDIYKDTVINDTPQKVFVRQDPARIDCINYKFGMDDPTRAGDVYKLIFINTRTNDTLIENLLHPSAGCNGVVKVHFPKE